MRGWSHKKLLHRAEMQQAHKAIARHHPAPDTLWKEYEEEIAEDWQHLWQEASPDPQ